MKKILYVLLTLALAGGIYGYYLWNKPHKDVQAAKTDVAIAADQLYKAYVADEAAANALYLDKTIAVTGVVRSSEKNADGTAKIVLETGDPDGFGVSCELDPLTKHARTDFQAGETVTLKGLCAGFNLDVQLARCVLQ
jgi:hypothetical protein